MRRDLIAIAGSLAQKPGYGGHTWALLQYALGFRELGWDVLFLDEISSKSCRDDAGRPCAPSASVNLRYAIDVFDRFGLGDRFALSVDDGAEWYGVDRPRVLTEVARSAFLLNIMGYLSDEEVLARAPLRVFLDIDPGFGQMWQALGLHDAFVGYDAHITIAERIGEFDCDVPTCGIDWITTAQPVVVSYWPVTAVRSETFTSVASWRGAYGPVEYRGKTYGLRVHEFRKFIDLPRRSALPFELALDIDQAETPDLDRLGSGGWILRDPRVVAADPWRYRDYIQDAAAEFMVAKNMYVESRCGWLSDRSLCYLASGRPVLAQDTGWTRLYAARRGLVPFSTLDEAEDGAASIVADYEQHSRAARGLAIELFGSQVILPRLLSKLGLA